jgi:hypothetical protein
MGPKFSVDDVKAQSEKMHLKANRLSPENLLVLNSFKKVKDTLRVANKMTKKGTKAWWEHKHAMSDFIALTYPAQQSSTKTPKKQVFESDDEDAVSSFL